MIYKKTILFILACTSMIVALPSSLPATAQILVSPSKNVLHVKPQTKACAIINIQLPPKGYIYANPKGDGTGKPTVAYAKANFPITIHHTRYLPGMRYVSPLDNKPVYIYKDETSLAIPFTVETTQEGTFTMAITVEALFCDDVSCTPITKTINQKIVVTDNAPDYTTQCSQYKEPSAIAHNDYPESTFTSIEIGTSSLSLTWAIIFGILAGFLLNFMPCVLPVISLKIFHFVSYANNNPRQVKISGILFTAGIITSFVVLASLAAFAGYNWGQLFQSQSFLIIMAAIIFAMSLSFFGVYTFTLPAIPTLQSANAYIDSYFKGIIATLLATPCSGPFLGATLAWSLSQHPVIIFMIFINIGLGMSLPYILLTFFPALIKFIPKPGNWLITFEQFMGFLLVATTLYLLTLLETSSLVKSLWLLFLVSLGLWQWGRYGNISMPKIKRAFSFAILVLCIIAGVFLFTSSSSSHDEISYTQFEWEAIVTNKDSQIAMVVFTADWCPNCKFVEATALASSRVLQFIQNHSIHVYKADITTTNDQAQTLMKMLNARSIPFVAIFPKGANFNNPVILRDLYTASDCVNALQKAVELSSQSSVPHMVDIHLQ